MAKKKASARKPSGTAAVETIEDIEESGTTLPADREHAADVDDAGDASHSASNGKAGKPERKAKAKAEPQANGTVAVGDIRKAAAFANSIGGLDKALALLQILKVAKDMQ